MHRVAVIGATGYAGQELVRLLARHPACGLTLATASQATSTPRDAAGAGADLGRRGRAARSRRVVAASADVAFLALPEAASAEVAPALLDAGLRVVDLSGAFRLRDDAARARWYPATPAMPEGVAYGSDRVRARRDSPARARVESRLLSDGGAAGAAAAGQRAG